MNEKITSNGRQESSSRETRTNHLAIPAAKVDAPGVKAGAPPSRANTSATKATTATELSAAVALAPAKLKAEAIEALDWLASEFPVHDGCQPVPVEALRRDVAEYLGHCEDTKNTDLFLFRMACGCVYSVAVRYISFIDDHGIEGWCADHAVEHGKPAPTSDPVAYWRQLCEEERQQIKEWNEERAVAEAEALEGGGEEPQDELDNLANARRQLTNAIHHLLERQLADCEIAYVWTEPDRIRIRTADDRTGDVEVLVNWDVVPTESPAYRSDAP